MTPPSATAPATETEASTSTRRPVHTARVGNVEIAVWQNRGNNGDFYTASAPTLRYKDGEEWKDGKSFGAMDLLALSAAAEEPAPRFAS